MHILFTLNLPKGQPVPQCLPLAQAAPAQNGGFGGQQIGKGAEKTASRAVGQEVRGQMDLSGTRVPC